MVFNFDDSSVKEDLYPFTATRNAADIRIGILTIREKWEHILKMAPGLEAVLPVLPANIIPTPDTATQILDAHPTTSNKSTVFKTFSFPWEIFQLNDWALREDFNLLTLNRSSAPLSPTNKLIGNGDFFLEQGASVEHCILNTTDGPIYIGKNAIVMEGSMIRGPFALCECAVLKMGAKVYGATTIGPYCIAAGEIKNSVMFGYSNKAHDGYLGDSVLGEWCNLGAGTSNSNVLNTASVVKVWQKKLNDFIPVGLKCGLLMGDYSRSAINTSFNTGTVVGVCCNIFGPGFPPKFIDDFSWGKERYTFEKALKDIDNWKKFKHSQLAEKEKDRLRQLYFNY